MRGAAVAAFVGLVRLFGGEWGVSRGGLWRRSWRVGVCREVGREVGRERGRMQDMASSVRKKGEGKQASKQARMDVSTFARQEDRLPASWRARSRRRSYSASVEPEWGWWLKAMGIVVD